MLRRIHKQPIRKLVLYIFGLFIMIETTRQVWWKPPKAELVIIHSYLKTGSSLLGEVFNQNPEAFYWYEPLDGVYSSIYGTAQGYNVPSDIVAQTNGAPRVIPEHELQTVSDVLTSILTCRFWRLPPALLVHQFFKTKKSQYKSMQPYIRCLDEEMEEPDCFFDVLCNKRFKEYPTKDEKCRNIMSDITARRVSCGGHVDGHLDCTSSNMTACAICKYNGCLQTKLTAARRCIDLLEDACLRAKIRVVKTVRLTMDSVQRVRKQLPTLKVVHHYREPKEVVWARRTDPNFRSNTYQYSAAHEAVIYCTQVSNDINKSLQMIPSYSDPFLVLSKYDDITQRPLEALNALYKFIDRPIPHLVSEWLRKKLTDGKILQYENFLDDMPYETVKRVDNACKPLYKFVNSR